jgi:hypothetical protein
MNTKPRGRRARPAAAARLAAVPLRLVVCASGLTAIGESAEPSPIITLRVADYAQVPDGALTAAERKAQRLLHEAGVDTNWLQCPSAGAPVGPEPPSGPADFFLTVASKVMRERRSEQDALGFALPCPHGKTGCMAYIFYPRIETLAADGDASLSDILGHVLAHEIGHLMLGPVHSPTGIMQAEWKRKDFQRAARNQLSFTRDQAEALRATATARTTLEHPQELSIVTCPE